MNILFMPKNSLFRNIHYLHKCVLYIGYALVSSTLTITRVLKYHSLNEVQGFILNKDTYDDILSDIIQFYHYSVR